jgi:hypothetical protein
MNRRFSTNTGWIIVILIICQFVPLNRIVQNPLAPKTLPAGIAEVLKKHCMTCHSNATRWPASAWIAPLSWYVTSRVRQARTAFELSGYDTMSEADKIRVAEKVSQITGTLRVADHGKIPGFANVKLSDRECRQLIGWPTNNNRE